MTRLLARSLVAIVILGSLAAIAGAVLVRDATDAREHLTVAEAAIQRFTTTLSAGDVQAADDDLATAATSVGQARSAASGPLWNLAGRLPLVGRAPNAVQDIVRVAEALVAVADAATRHATVLLGARDADLRVVDGVVDLRQLEATREALERLPLQQLRLARDRLEGAEVALAPAEIRQARRDALAQADRAIGTATDTRQLLEILPGFLGADGPRRYLLAIQTPAELRGTGGLLGYVGVLNTDDGEMILENTTVVDPTEVAVGVEEPATLPEPGPLAELGGRVPTPVTTSREFRDRYQHVGAASFFSNVNVDPDLPTTAPVMLDLYERYTGQSLDGVIAVDPVGLGRILSAIGPVELSSQRPVETGDLPTTVPADQIARVTTVDIYEEFGFGQPEQRGVYFDALSRGAFEQVFSGSWDAVAVARRVGEASAGRHVQLHSRNEAEQAVFEQIGIAGALVAAQQGADLLAVTANNAVGGKQDVHLGHHLTVSYSLGAVADLDGTPWASRTGTVEVEVENPLPADGRDLYIIGNCLVNVGRNACFEGAPGWNRTWFTMWTPPDATTRVTGADGQARYFTVGEIHGQLATDQFLETPPRDSRSFAVEATGYVPLRRDGPDLVYELTLWRQSKAIPDHWDVTIAAPDGWDVAGVNVAGGGDGTGMGVAREGPPVAGEIIDGVAHVRGAATEDVHIEVRFSRPLWDRFRDWLNSPVS